MLGLILGNTKSAWPSKIGSRQLDCPGRVRELEAGKVFSLKNGKVMVLILFTSEQVAAGNDFQEFGDATVSSDNNEEKLILLWTAAPPTGLLVGRPRSAPFSTSLP